MGEGKEEKVFILLPLQILKNFPLNIGPGLRLNLNLNGNNPLCSLQQSKKRKYLPLIPIPFPAQNIHRLLSGLDGGWEKI
jgi:hypothetical protein